MLDTETKLALQQLVNYFTSLYLTESNNKSKTDLVINNQSFIDFWN